MEHYVPSRLQGQLEEGSLACSETKMELFGHFAQKHTIPMVKDGGGRKPWEESVSELKQEDSENSESYTEMVSKPEGECY